MNSRSSNLRYQFAGFFLLPVVALCALLVACSTPGGATAPADPVQVAKLTLVAGVITEAGVAVALEKDPGSRAALLAVAEAIEQAAALPDAPAPSNLTGLVSAAAVKYGGPYGALAGIGLQAGLQIYSQLYQANATNALDKQPAFKAVLVALARGIRAGVVAADSGTPRSQPVPELSPEDFLQRAAS
jgi:hypothetical protein